MKVGAAAWRLALFAGVMIVVLAVVFTAIKRPVSGDTEPHDALFTDANGLKVGDDVRMYGVQVGKIEGVSLDGARARIRLSLKTDAPIYDNSKLAIRYQNLTGQRYIDLQQQPQPGARIPAGATVGTEHTVPSFDVTSMFNGLKPVLDTISPEAINQFSASMVALIEGDGSGVGPALDAIGKFASYVDDRQQVIGTLIHNMSDLSDKVGGRVHYLVPLLARLTDVFQALQTNIGGLAQFAMAAPSVLGPLDNLFDVLGLQTGTDVDALIRNLFPDPQQALEVLDRLPGLLASLDATTPKGVAGWKPQCSKGTADVPQVFGILIAGQQVAVCNG
ncbi:phospholipid/cholesterol/gamma-HCH transport system substrate-binding protein [Nocardia transvalensis]|uniref:Phospholipid/cholesterol/gamma-HCH transport system substrate-binding protein n=1 Tax=Nocardia transvalensis TaxID=37333 RepID=A0A7W9PG31_9NOCA|nr:MlaD family protein [Nocardia transvalensis]MBB5915013.1 phospholipid/cholesterol/gamma-HCH transport system substrate-binding protein [Nocardia transvalensis]